MKKNFDSLMYLLIVLILSIGLIGTFHQVRATNNAETKEIPVKKIEAVQFAKTVETPEPVQTTTYFDVPLSEDLQDYIFELCEQRDINPAIIIAMIERESNFKASIMGDNGNSYGLMQIQPRWHKKRMNTLGCQDLLDPYQNVTVGIDYFADLCSEGKGTTWALMAYNGGPGYANKKASRGVVSDYASSILANSKNLERK